MGRSLSPGGQPCTKGSIYTSERCPLCGGKLQHDENRGGLFCANHPDIKAQHNFRVIFDRQIKRRFKSYPEAIRFLTVLRFLEDQGSLDPRDFCASNPLAFANQANRWLQVKEKEVRHNTYRDLRRTMHLAIDAWGQRNVKKIGYAEIEDFLYALDVSDKTRANARAHLHQFFSWMTRRENIPMPEMPKIRYELGWRNIVDLETQAKILDELYRQTWDRNPRIWIGVRWLATYVAIRPGELRNLRERDIDVNGFFVVPSPKEKKPKLVPMLDEDLELYHSLPQGLPDLYFFRHLKGNGAAAPGSRFSKDYLYRCWKRACHALGVDGVDLYGGTRHSTASALGQYFSKEELREHGTMHATNKAFDRYMQFQAAPSRKIYEKARELAAGGNTKANKPEKAKNEE